MRLDRLLVRDTHKRNNLRCKEDRGSLREEMFRQALHSHTLPMLGVMGPATRGHGQRVRRCLDEGTGTEQLLDIGQRYHIIEEPAISRRCAARW